MLLLYVPHLTRGLAPSGRGPVHFDCGRTRTLNPWQLADNEPSIRPAIGKAPAVSSTGGDAANVWADSTPARELARRFEHLYGIW
jgi:hypothetical protein